MQFRFWGTLLLSAVSSAQSDPEHGRIVFLLCNCDGCHSNKDYSRLGGPVAPGGSGIGQLMPEAGLPGKVVAPNITPDKQTGIGSWSDNEIGRAIRTGIGRDGRTLLPVMPYYSYAVMSDRDLKALVAYLKTLPAVENALPRTELPQGFKLPSPPPAKAPLTPDPANRVKYGEYLATLGMCAGCHTPEGPDHRPDKSKRFAGGRVWRFVNGLQAVTSNITPDPDTGIGKWSEQQFISRFQAYRRYTNEAPPKVGPEGFTLMPWLALSQLSREDLAAIYAYLRTIPAVTNRVTR